MDIETRLESLENDIRRQKDDLHLHKRLWMGAACLLAEAIVLGATRPAPKVIVAEEIVAERFIVKDASGKPRSTWLVGKDGEVLLGMLDGGKPRLAIFVRKKDVGMFVSDPGGKGRLSAGMLKGEPHFSLFDKNGKPQVFINAIDRDGSPSIAVLDSSNQVRASMGFTEGTSPAVILKDRNGKIRSLNGLTDEDEPNMALLDKDGYLLWVAPPRAKKK
jgi:hypothetical protein